MSEPRGRNFDDPVERLAFIRWCVDQNPGGYTEEFKFLLPLAERAAPSPALTRETPSDYALVQAWTWASKAGGNETTSFEVDLARAKRFLSEVGTPPPAGLDALRLLQLVSAANRVGQRKRQGAFVMAIREVDAYLSLSVPPPSSTREEPAP